ncbi:MAG: inositol monophosphatase family protein [Polyangiales bacterium]
MNDPQLLELMREAAAAGAAVMEKNALHVTGERVAFDLKGTSIDLVTEVDRASEAAVLAVLKRAGIPVVAEEGGGVGGETVFYVDPVDGTTNYAHGHPFACVSIGLVEAGVPVLGVVHAPMLGVLWSGGPSLGATRRDLFRGLERPLAVSRNGTLRTALGATGFPIDRHTSSDDNLAAFGAMSKRAQGVLRCGSAAIDLAMVADGTFDLYWERKLRAWDVAAGAALVLAAGGKVTDPWGRPLVVTSGTVAATNGLLHDALLEVIAPHQPEAT